MTDRKELARRLACEKAILDELDERNQETRDQARELYESGDADTASLNGATFGRVRRDNPRRVWRVVDWAAFERWVAEHLPEKIISIPQVDPSFRSSVLKTGHYINVDGEFLEPDGIALVEQDGNLVVTTTDEAKAWANALLTASLPELEAS